MKSDRGNFEFFYFFLTIKLTGFYPVGKALANLNKDALHNLTWTIICTFRYPSLIARSCEAYHFIDEYEEELNPNENNK